MHSNCSTVVKSMIFIIYDLKVMIIDDPTCDGLVDM